MREVEQDLATALNIVEGAGECEAKILMDHGIASLEDLANAEDDLLPSIPGISEESAVAVKERAGKLHLEKLEREAAAAREENEREEGSAPVVLAPTSAATENGPPGS